VIQSHLVRDKALARPNGLERLASNVSTRFGLPAFCQPKNTHLCLTQDVVYENLGK